MNQAKVWNLRTARHIVSTYKRQGFRLKHPDDRIHPDLKRMGRPRARLDEIKDWISSKSPEWQFHTLDDRRKEIKEAKGIEVSRVTLSSWYKRSGWLRVMPTHKISSRYKTGEMLLLQEELVGKLYRYWQEGKEIVFIDECSAHAWVSDFDDCMG